MLLVQEVEEGGKVIAAALIIAPANISELDDVFAWFIVPLNAVACF
jgi:hypothetical protein